MYGHQPPPHKPRGFMTPAVGAGLGCGIAGLVVGAIIGVYGASGDGTATASAGPSQQQQETAEALDQRDERLDAREDKLDKRSDRMHKRDNRLDKAEQKRDRSTVPGDGSYVVGEDMKPGEYKTPGPSESSIGGGCYYEITAGPDQPNNILSNNISKGAGVVSVSRGQVFTTNGCQDWTRSN